MLLRTTLAAVALCAVADVSSAQVGQKPPVLDVLEWYNSPPIDPAQMNGRAVLIEVFRTW